MCDIPLWFTRSSGRQVCLMIDKTIMGHKCPVVEHWKQFSNIFRNDIFWKYFGNDFPKFIFVHIL